jgi:hypothetical protein
MAAELIQDPTFGVSTGDTSTLKIKRSVEMYEWTNRVGGEAAFYDATFSSSLIDSTQFRNQNDEYHNPTRFPLIRSSWKRIQFSWVI